MVKPATILWKNRDNKKKRGCSSQLQPKFSNWKERRICFKIFHHSHWESKFICSSLPTFFSCFQSEKSCTSAVEVSQVVSYRYQSSSPQPKFLKMPISDFYQCHHLDHTEVSFVPRFFYECIGNIIHFFLKNAIKQQNCR